MKESSLGFSRREFLKSSASYVGAATVGSTALGKSVQSKVCVAPDCALPLATAASEIAEVKGSPIVRRKHNGFIREGEIVLVSSDEIGNYPQVADLISGHEQDEWELVKPIGKGLLISGSSPRNVCRAALGWLEHPEQETNRFSVFEFEERFTMWDNALNQWYRYSKGFDREKHIRQIALIGHTGLEINRYADPGGYHVLHRKFPYDSYAWYLSYAPALDAFVESSLTEGIYPKDELAANLNDLRKAAALARRYGLKPGFVCYEPRSVAEEIFDRHPQVRGSRTDHPGRSLQPRYALDIAHPQVLEHYDEMLTKLMHEVPELRYLVFWTGDSGSGLPFASRLYFGPNGSYLARSKKVEQMAADFAGTLLTAGRRINPEFEVIMEIGWEYTEGERLAITAALPNGVTVSHMLGGRLMDGGDFGDRVRYIEDDRERGKEPYGGFTVSTRWDPEPVMGVPAPSVLLKKFADLRKYDVRKTLSEGGTLSPPQCPYSINQRVYTESLRGEISDPGAFLLETAREWCEGEEQLSRLLVKAWKQGDQALDSWPVLNWYHAGPAQTQGKWVTRPVVPDISKLSDYERSAWERNLFTLPWDIGRQNIVFEGGIRMYREEQLEKAVRGYDEKMLPLLAETVATLDEALAIGRKAVLEDQRDRYLGLLLRERTVRNLFEAQVSINHYLLRNGDLESRRKTLDGAIRAEIENTKEWLRLLRESKTNWFRVAELQETPFLYKTPVPDLELKLEAMQAHLDDEPGPYLEELRSANSEAELLFYNGSNTLERS